MKSIFDLNSPLMQMLTKVGDMILANVLFLICCLPVVTIGASVAALQKVTQDIIHDTETGLIKTFFRAFASNFKQATIAWIVVLLFLLGLGCNLFLVMVYFTGNMATILKSVLAVILVLITSVCVWLFPLLVRYNNGLRRHCYNAAMLMIIKLPKTVLLVLMTLAPVLIAWVDMQVFVDTLVFWLIIGFAFVSYMGSSLLAPVFKELETDNVSVMK